MSLLDTHAAPIPGMVTVRSRAIEDARGSFARLFCAQSVTDLHPGKAIMQINQSVTQKAGTLRGLHFQKPPASEGKWVRCLSGRVFDVCVDLRAGSPGFLHHHAVILDAADMNAVYIPEGCAHGFQTLVDDCVLLYLHTAPYSPDHEVGVAHDDPRLGIDWPLPTQGLSPRDRAFDHLDPNFEGIQC